MAASILKINKDEVKKVVGSILGGEEEKELDFKKSFEKFEGMYKQAKRYCILFELLWNHDCLDNYEKEKGLVQSYASLIHQEVENNFEKYDKTKLSLPLETYPLIAKDNQEDVTTFLKYYNQMKKASLVHTIINTGNNMIDYKMYLEDSSKLDDSFLTRSSMLTWEPVQDLRVNFKLLYVSMSDERGRKFLMSLLHKLYDITAAMYKERGRVDIDTGAFVKAVHATVDKLRKEIPRCDEAFKKNLRIYWNTGK